MSITIAEAKTHLTGMTHSGTLNRVRNVAEMFHRAANTLLSLIDPITTMRTGSLSNLVHDDLNDYALPGDYKKLIDLIPQDNRDNWDNAYRNLAGQFDREKAIRNRVLSIEGSEGSKIIRINWKTRTPKVLNSMNSHTSNGTWSVVAGATNLALDEIYKRKGSASIRFDVAATGDGIDNDDMTAVSLSDEDEIADVLFDLYIEDATDLARITSITTRWGNDLTTNYWVGVAQTTQADGSALQVGWNEIKVPWSTATETGTVAPATIDSFRFTLTVTAAVTKLRIDNVRFSIGRPFEMKYYSKYLLKNSAGTWIQKTTSESDTIVLDDDEINGYLYECLIAAAHQMEGSDAVFDINFAKGELEKFYRRYRAEYPSMSKKAVTNYGGSPRWNRWKR